MFMLERDHSFSTFAKFSENFFWNNVSFLENFGNVLNAEAATGYMFCKKGVFKNFAKFTGKHVSQSLYFNKVAGLSLRATASINEWSRIIFSDLLTSWQQPTNCLNVFDHFAELALTGLKFEWKKNLSCRNTLQKEYYNKIKQKREIL